MTEKPKFMWAIYYHPEQIGPAFFTEEGAKEYWKMLCSKGFLCKVITIYVQLFVIQKKKGCL